MATEEKTEERYQVTVHHSVADIAAHEWNALVAADDLPFLEWEWYAALECSGSIAPAQGWQPVHIAVRREGRVVAIAPLYAKMHSWGELAFDHAWQHVAAQIGIDYFPKLVGMVPTTPCSGYKFLIARCENEELLTDLIVRMIEELIGLWDIKTVAFNFVDRAWGARLQRAGYSLWAHSGFSWHNSDFATFQEYQAQFTKNQRRNIRREREAFAREGLRAKVARGDELPTSYFRLMHRYYLATNEKFGPFAAHFLNEAFFDHIAEKYRHRIIFCCCFRAEEYTLSYAECAPIAMAMFIYKNAALYGRYWGCRESMDMMHFNVCYYEPIAWAIKYKYRYFDLGIGGSHKLRRGFVADSRYTALYFSDQKMREIVAYNQERINGALEHHLALLNSERPLTKEAHAYSNGYPSAD